MGIKIKISSLICAISLFIPCCIQAEYFLRLEQTALRNYWRFVCICKITGQKIGYSVFNPTTGHLDYLAVRANYTRNGYGKILFDATEQYLRENAKTKKMFWESTPFTPYSPPQQALNTIYKKWGGIPNPQNPNFFTKLLK